MSEQNDSQGTMVFVLGLLSILMCQILGPVAWMMGSSYQAQCEANGTTPNQLGTAGKYLGMVGTALLALNLVVTTGVFCMYGAIIAAAIADI
jgi:hypothetical protein